jgi:hypothetical protein
MGFWNKAFRTIQDLTSLGGTYRLRAAKERYASLFHDYETICRSISERRGELAELIGDVNARVLIARNHLKSAARMLDHFGEGSPGTASANSTSLVCSESTSLVVPKQGIIDEFLPTMIGAGVGAATAATTWGAVQFLGHASTGVAISTLHGAAATSAGWAAIGGGSLAAGGGGIAAGHLVLPGIGTAVAVTVSAVMSHSEANKVEKICDQLQEAHDKNSAALSIVRSDLKIVTAVRAKLIQEDELLGPSVAEARQRLFRFGFLSQLWRWLRHWFGGSYYKEDELRFVGELEAAVMRFVAAFEAKRNP